MVFYSTAFGSHQLADGAAGIAKAINNKAAQRQLEELKYHNRIMEDHGVYFVSVDDLNRKN